MPYTLVLDQNGNGIGSHFYMEEPDSYPDIEVSCTSDQANNPAMWSLSNGILVESLSVAQSQQIELLRAACAASIVGGYQSSALGDVYTYPSALTDQINMLGSVSASQLSMNQSDTWTTPFLCADPSGNWAYQMHTAAQIQQAGNDGKVWVATCQLKLSGYLASVAAATTVADVQAVVWS